MQIIFNLDDSENIISSTIVADTDSQEKSGIAFIHRIQNALNHKCKCEGATA